MAAPSRRLTCRRAALVFHMTQRMEAFLSFNVKYTCPEAGRDKLEISPSTHTSCRVGSLSSCLRIRNVSWETVRWLEENKVGCIDGEDNLKEMNVEGMAATLQMRNIFSPIIGSMQ